MPKFREDHGEMDAEGSDTTRTSVRLPGLDIEVTRRPAAEGDAEEISINLRAVPSFEAFGRALQATNPLVFWARSAQAAWLTGWLPWLEAARMMGLPSTRPWGLAPALRPGMPSPTLTTGSAAAGALAPEEIIMSKDHRTNRSKHQ